jgi:type IV pilus assembly protein PilC
VKFNYQARTKIGEVPAGVVEANSKEAAAVLLRAKGLFVTALEETAAPFYTKRIRLFERITKKEVVALSRQLAIMFKAEIPLVEILQTLAKQTENRALREKIVSMTEKVEGGSSLSKTFALYPEIFNPFYINMVKAGEASGKLSGVFTYLADHLEKDYDFNSKIRMALIYPAFLASVFLLIGGLMVFFVVPQLTDVLKETGKEMPVITRVLIAAADFLRKWGILVIGIAAVMIGAVVYYSRTKEGKIFFDKNFLKLPVVGSFLKKIYLSRFALNLSTLISGGLPIVHAIEISGEIVGSNVYKKIILETSDGVKRGEAISSLLERYPGYITPLFIQMVVVGEKTGRLDASLLNIIDFYQKDIDKSLDGFMRLLEPILIVFFGVVVGGLMIAIIMPLYQAVSTF